MAKKKSVADQINKWSNVINDSFERQREIDQKLSPSKSEIRYLVDYARVILEKATRIETVSALAHENVITFEKAQSVIDWQKQQLERDIKHLQMYLTKDDAQ